MKFKKKSFIIIFMLVAIFLITTSILFPLGGVGKAKATATYGNATGADLLSGKTATVDAGQITGTMTNKTGSGTVITPGPVDQVIPLGYFGGVVADGKVAALVVPAANVLAGTTIAGTAGTMPNRSVESFHQLSLNTVVGDYDSEGYPSIYLIPPSGYYNGGSWIRVREANFLAANILSGKNILGVVGTGISVFSAGDSQLVNSSTIKWNNTYPGGYIKQKEITVNGVGTIRVSFDMYVTSSNLIGDGRVYKNGIAVGILRTTSSTSSTTYTEDFSVESGDKIQLFTKWYGGSGYVYVRNFKISVQPNIPYCIVTMD